MKYSLYIVVFVMLIAVVLTTAFATPPRSKPREHFATVAIIIDTGPHPLAAYQLQLSTNEDDAVKIVGIEGGDATPYDQPPYYDPAAMLHDTVIIAAFSTNSVERLPRGRVRIATVHYLTTSDDAPHWSVKPIIAADQDGRPIDVTITLQNSALPEGATP